VLLLRCYVWKRQQESIEYRTLELCFRMHLLLELVPELALVVLVRLQPPWIVLCLLFPTEKTLP
jgi:hypothetical protein